ncbi:anaerobic ribonucleoside-triphosphate reductase activating protein [Polaribacter sp. Hel1_85]|uniref:anaerobic ribonucleoside-triphosphate reductase activating protein n=1 Tax=Polaribacter sp. Hel1_85 TaxID=1250005 RepID=UPI00052BAAFD|nr:anaerobic ribonucleoside-triphosphate reductase activating protein [Polaribacter sp. Hel1_85]KGL64041.1 ribonucleotide reductase of class III (anaerobic), activating protein [Polaribacter sp. Hel1_85]
MNYYNIQVALQEVPGEISICFSICGCQIRCKGCHSPFLWKEENGLELSKKIYTEILNNYKGFATCILFMGGEWHQKKIIEYLKYAQKEGYKTCLYSGEKRISKNLLQHLTWVKTGKWIAEKGGLENPKTNQQFIEVQTNNILNHLFLKNY